MHRNRRRRSRRGQACRLTLPCRCHEWSCEWYPLSACPCVSCFVAVLGFTLVCLLLIYQGIRLLLWLQGTAFFSFCVRAFCMRLLNSIHDEIVGNRSVPIGFASISRLKSPYKRTVQSVCTRVTVGKRLPFVRAPKTYAYS